MSNSNPQGIEGTPMIKQQHGYQSENSIQAKVSHDISVCEKERAGSDGSDTQGKKSGPKILREADCPQLLGYAWPTWKKWQILVVIFLVQCSMNFNTSLYANGQKKMAAYFGIPDEQAVWGAGLFLVFYAFGCELWAPWSEEFGRKPIMQASLFFVNVWCLMVALAPNMLTVLIGRSLGGLFSAGGSITLGIVADMYRANDQQYAVNFVVLASVGGSIFGPIFGGLLEDYVDDWRWTIWLQLIVGAFVQLLHFILVPETRTTSLLAAEARRRRENGVEQNVYGPRELKTWKDCMQPRELWAIWSRPFMMFVREPIVLILSMLSGFSDGLIFLGFQSFGKVYEIWGFTPSQTGFTFIAIGLGYVIGWATFMGAIKRNKRLQRENPGDEFTMYESRLWWLMFTAPCLPIGLFIFSWTSTHAATWFSPVFGSLVIGIANFAVYMATIDYMVAAYGEYSASATGGNGFARDLIAGILTFCAEPYYGAFQKAQPNFYLQWANTTLGFVSLFLVALTFWVYFNGPKLRANSPFAQKLMHEGADAVQAQAGHQRSEHV